MKSHRTSLALLLELLLLAAAAAGLTPQAALAQVCTDPATGQVIPCPREKKTKVPTPVPPTRTPTPTATPAGIPLTGGDGGGAASDGIRGTPAVQLRAFATGGFLIGLLILVLFLGGVFDPKTGLFKRFGLFGHSVNTDPGGQTRQKPNSVSIMNSSLQLPGIPNDPNTSGNSEVLGNDQIVTTGDPQQVPVGRNDGYLQQVGSGTTAHELGHDLDADHDGLNQNWEQGGNIDMNTDGTNTAEQGDTSSSMHKPPEDA